MFHVSRKLTDMLERRGFTQSASAGLRTVFQSARTHDIVILVSLGGKAGRVEIVSVHGRVQGCDTDSFCATYNTRTFFGANSLKEAHTFIKQYTATK